MKRILLLIVLFICLLGITGCSEDEFIRSGKISCTQKEKILKYENVKIIDVRAKEEYDERHLDNAINIPYENIVEEIKNDSSINKDTPIIVYCKSGARSEKAYNSLKDAGYNHIYNLGAITSCD